jgi:uncharacterized repeat protein (TIGR03803 family)
LPQTGVFNPFALVTNQKQFDGSRASCYRDWRYLSGEDGSWPQGVVEGGDGILYGTTQVGGRPGSAEYATGSGTVFKVNKDGSGYAVLHRFPGLSGDGISPWAGLVQGRDGALYGTTLGGGTNGAGTVFKLNKDGSGYAVLHSFPDSVMDGANPMAGLLAGSDGWFYGTTDGGGTSSARNGTVFKLKPGGSGYKVLHDFPEIPGDGRFPRSSLVEGRDGTLYGTTQNGGTDDAGTVFKLNKDGTGYRVLTRFSHQEEGVDPTGLVQGSDGALYGTTDRRGKNDGGTAFKLNLDGSGFTILHSFPGTEGDGRNPCRSMVQGSDGALYGMTKICSTNNFATMFKLALSGSRPTPAPVGK